MIRPYLSALGLVLGMALLPLAAQSQTAEQLLLLQSNPGLASELQGMTRGTTQPTEGIGVPTADGTQALNAQDAIADPDLLLQSTSRGKRAKSVIQDYYRILTGDILDIYGAAEFAQQQDNQLLFFNTMGKDYRLAAGDVIRVTLRGLTESDQSLKIGRDGNLILPSLPPILVSGFTIAEVEEKLLDILRLDDASASAYLSLETARLITVQISGAVNAPRTLAVPAYTPLSRVLAYAGGIKPTGSLRNIILRERDGSVERVDFYNFLQSPIGANDPIVSDSARIFVGNQGPTVAAQGFVARPGIYELSEGAREISVEDLLALSGTSIIPPGLEIEAIHFDDTGTTRIRPLTRTSMLQAGEVLNLRFVETRLQEAVTVMGAVLDEYSRATSTPLSVSKLLKNGATLAQNARLDFALIIDKTGTGRAIDLRSAIFDPSALIAPGSTLVILDQPSYRRLVRANPNTTNDPLLAALQRTDVAEIYLNGTRIAYLAPTSNRSLSDIIQPYYTINKDTYLHLAIIQRDATDVEAFDVRDMLQNNKSLGLNPGDALHFFDTIFLRKIGRSRVMNDDAAALSGTDTNTSSMRDLLLSDAVLEVNFNGANIAYLPAQQSERLEDVLDVLGISDIGVFADTVGMRFKDDRFETRSLRGDATLRFQDLESIDFLEFGTTTSAAFQNENKALYQNLVSSGVSVYLDGKLETISGPKSLQTKSTDVFKILTDPNIYPYFVIIETFDFTEATWTRRPATITEIIQAESTLVPAGSNIYLLSRSEISSLYDAKTSTAAAQLALSDSNGEFIEADEVVGDSSAIITTSPYGSIPGGKNLARDFSKFIIGAVGKPGPYPIVNEISLDNLLKMAGGLSEAADLQHVTVQIKKSDAGVLTNGPLIKYDLTKVDPSKIILSDRYSVNVPNLVNDAEAGLISIEGEILYPGDYVFSREDTLHDLLERAGGITSVAYPLGSFFTRESLKTQQRANNHMLASQIEQVVLQLSQSDRESAAEQISAVLNYAEQLRSQDVAGRLSVNILLREQSAPIYLETGDKLFVPKRPSHVSVIGSVQSDGNISYRDDKTLSDYVMAAGGYTKIADPKRAYILLPNGENAPATKGSIIPPGSVIVIPPKVDRLSALGLTDIVSRVLGNIATSVLAINNVR